MVHSMLSQRPDSDEERLSRDVSCVETSTTTSHENTQQLRPKDPIKWLNVRVQWFSWRIGRLVNKASTWLLCNTTWLYRPIRYVQAQQPHLMVAHDRKDLVMGACESRHR